MEKLAQLMLDIKDDPQASLLREVFPTYQEVPDIIKTASREEPEEHEYALVLLNDGYKFKKFAMHDAGNTALSILYFLNSHDRLPEEAVKVASENLIDAAGRFKLKVPKELENIVDSLRSKGIEIRTREKHWQPVDSLDEVSEISSGKLKRNSEKTASAGRHLDNVTFGGAFGGVSGVLAGGMAGAGIGAAEGGIKGAIKGGLKGAAGGGLAGAGVGSALYGGLGAVLPNKPSFGVILPPKIRPSHYMDKSEDTDYEGEIDRYNEGKKDKDKLDNIWKKKDSQKEASARGFVHRTAHSTHDGGEALYTTDKGPQKAISTGNEVDVSKVEAPKHKIVLDAKHKLMDQYPVDTIDQIKMATDYFQEYWRDFEPAQRHEYCVKLANRLQANLMPVPESIGRYGSDTYSSDLENHVAYRKNFVDQDLHDVLDTLVSQQEHVRPETFAEALTAFDKTAGIDKYWDSKLYDPYKTTFGPSLLKEAEDHWNYKEMGLYINERDLKNLANADMFKVREQFGAAFADKYRANPKKAFESLDSELKLILARLASNNY